MAAIPFTGFAPSRDPTTPGLILACSNLIPTLRGMAAAKTPTPFGNPAFSPSVSGAATCEMLGGNYRTFVGTPTKLYEVVDGNNIDQSAFAYTGGTNPWRFAQFGNASLATNNSDPIQQSVLSGPFTQIPSPLYEIVVNSPGTGFTSDPTVTISGGGGGTATATATLNGSGGVASITLTNAGGTANNGEGFTSVPTVTVSGGGGTGCTATAVVLWPPAAAILEVVSGFVFLFNTTDQVLGERSNGWWCSGLYDQTDWVASQSTQSAYGIIIDTPGQVTAGKALGTNLIAYKRNSMYYGNYQGPPVIWAFNLISPQIGVPSQECVINVGTRHLFMATDCQVYEVDGSLIPQPIGNDVKDWLALNWSKRYQENVQNYHDEPNSTVYWYFCSINNTSGIPDTCLVYNYLVGKFGRADATIQATVQAISGQITWEGMGSLPNVSTWSTLPDVAFDSAYWVQSSQQPGYIDANSVYQSLSGAPGESSLTTGWIGDDYNYTAWSGILPRFSVFPTSCSGTAVTAANLANSASYLYWTLGAIYDGEIPADFGARWAQITMNFTGPMEILGFSPKVTSAGAV